jgi:hypothetical protein
MIRVHKKLGIAEFVLVILSTLILSILIFGAVISLIRGNLIFIIGLIISIIIFYFGQDTLKELDYLFGRIIISEEGISYISWIRRKKVVIRWQEAVKIGIKGFQMRNRGFKNTPNNRAEFWIYAETTLANKETDKSYPKLRTSADVIMFLYDKETLDEIKKYAPTEIKNEKFLSESYKTPTFWMYFNNSDYYKTHSCYIETEENYQKAWLKENEEELRLIRQKKAKNDALSMEEKGLLSKESLYSDSKIICFEAFEFELENGELAFNYNGKTYMIEYRRKRFALYKNTDKNYKSAVCEKYATKEAMLADARIEGKTLKEIFESGAAFWA